MKTLLKLTSGDCLENQKLSCIIFRKIVVLYEIYRKTGREGIMSIDLTSNYN
jgi:hypothetical protein